MSLIELDRRQPSDQVVGHGEAVGAALYAAIADVQCSRRARITICSAWCCSRGSASLPHTESRAPHGAAIPASSRTLWAAAESLCETHSITSRMRRRLASATAAGRSAATWARPAGSWRRQRNTSQVLPGTPTALMTTLSLIGHSRGRLRPGAWSRWPCRYRRSLSAHPIGGRCALTPHRRRPTGLCPLGRAVAVGGLIVAVRRRAPGGVLSAGAVR
jgi:hypothetical protein